MPRKLGQHFLNNRSAVKKIIDALELKKGEVIIEIGPGTGALTFPLAGICEEIGCRVVAVEKDKRLIETLRNSVEIYRNSVEIREGDILKILPEAKSDWKLGVENWKLTGNIPYYITGRLLRILSELELKPALTVLTIQKEVAERIAAQPPRMNLLAAITQFWSEPEIIATLKPRDFNPAPKINSAVIKLITKKIPSSLFLVTSYPKFIKILFKQPRKTISNNLRFGLKSNSQEIEKIIRKHGLNGLERPQNLSLELLIKLAGEFEKLGVL